MQDNATTSPTELLEEQTNVLTIETIRTLAGFSNFASNFTLFMAILWKKKRNRNDKLLAAYAMGAALLGLGYFADAIKYVTIMELTTMINPIYCLLFSPNLLFYAVGDNMATFAIFCMAVGSLVAISVTQISAKVRRCLNRMVVLCIMFPVLDAMWCWLSVMRKENEITIECDYMEVVGQAYALYHVCIVSIVGAISISVFVVAIFMLFRRKATSTSIRDIQIRREAAVMKQVMFIVLVTFLFLSMPNMLELLYVLNCFNVMVSENIWLMQHFGFSIAALYRILTDSTLRKILKKVCRCQKDGTVVQVIRCA